MRFVSFIVWAAAVLAPSVARAQAQVVEVEAPKGATEKDIQGLNPFMGLTSTLSLVDNESVIGQADGVSTLFGLGLLAGVDYVHDEHVLRVGLTVNEGFARTPVVDKFVKTNDVVKLDGLYNYFITKYFGAYGRLGFATSVLPSYDVRGLPTTWVDTTEMTPTTLRQNAFSQKLASAFKPFSINEAIGLFADPVREPEFNLSFRVGAAGRHTLADGVLVVHDDKMTPEIELLQLSDVHQFGAEAFAGANGKFEKTKANYRAGLAVLVPFVNNDKFSRTAGKLTRVAFEGNLTYAMNSWLSVVYSLVITRDPQLFPAGKEVVQVQNTMLLTFQLNLVKKKEKPKAKTKEEQALEDATKRADDAEKRATAAEQELQKLKAATPAPAPEPAPAPGPPPTTPTPGAEPAPVQP